MSDVPGQIDLDFEKEIADVNRRLAEAEVNQIEPMELRGKVLNMAPVTLRGLGCTRHPDLVDPPSMLLDRVEDLQRWNHPPTREEICSRATEIARIAASCFRKTPGLRAVLLDPPPFMVSQLEVQIDGKGLEPVYQMEPLSLEPGWLSPWVRVWPGGR